MNENKMIDIISKEFKSSGYSNAEVYRYINEVEIVEVQNTIKLKCVELIIFDKPEDGIKKISEVTEKDKIAVCIGYNPAECSKDIDVSNKRLIKLLKQHCYKGYVLLNLFPQITKSAKEVDLDLQFNKDFETSLMSYIKNNFNTSDVVIFFGRTTQITDKFKVFLSEISSRNKLLLTVNPSEKLFTHPGSNAGVLLKKVKIFKVKEVLTVEAEIEE